MRELLNYVASRGLAAGLLALAAGGSSLYGQIALTMNTSNAEPVAGGLFFSYTLAATNTGSTGPMSLTDFLPSGIQFLSVSSTASSLAARVICSGPPMGTSGSVVCSSPVFPAGGVATITILAQCAPDVQGVRENVADAIPTGPPFPERSSILQHVQSNTALQLFSSATAQVVAGNTASYNLLVLNSSVSSALGVVVEDQLPDSTSFVSATGTGGFHDACSFQPAFNKVVCFASQLPAGTGEITIVVKTADDKSQGALINTATVSAGSAVIAGSPASSTTTVTKK